MSSAEGFGAARRARAWGSWLELARISNTPTTVSNVIAGAAVAAGASVAGADAGLVAVAIAALYTAGMILNDVLDRSVDEVQRPERPLPSGRIAPAAAVAAVAALLGLGEGLLLAVEPRAGLGGLVLIVTIVVYDLWHKGNPLSPLLMGACRGLVYVVAALAVAGAVEGEVVVAAGLLGLYVVGLSQVAKAEGGGIAARWPVVLVLLPAAYWVEDIDRAGVAVLLVAFVAWVGWALRAVLVDRAIGSGVARLIAGVALYDAVVAASAGASLAAVLACLAAFALTVVLQTRIAGT